MKKWPCIVKTGAKRTRFGEIPAFAEGLYDLDNQVYAWLVPNGSWGESNAGLVAGDEESLLVDTLWDVRITRTMLSAMRPLVGGTGGAPITKVVNTHADGDHFWGNQLVESAEIITSAAALEEMTAVKPATLVWLGRMGRLMSALPLSGPAAVGNWFYQMVAPYRFQDVRHTPATRTFEGELSLNVGGRKVKLIQVGPAHTQGDVLVYVPDAKVLFTGDILFIASTPVMWAGPVKNWLRALDLILDLDVETIVPGHGKITDKDGARQIKAYWQYLENEATRCFKSGMSAGDAAYDIVFERDFQDRPFANWNSPERIMTNLHTIYRHLQGRTEHPSTGTILRMLREQAQLAQKMDWAEPAIMRS